MIIVDKALEKRQREGTPIRVGMIGAGMMGRGIALQILAAVPGMELVAIANRTLAQAKRAYREAGIESIKSIGTVAQMEEAIAKGEYTVTEP